MPLHQQISFDHNCEESKINNKSLLYDLLFSLVIKITTFVINGDVLYEHPFAHFQLSVEIRMVQSQSELSKNCITSSFLVLETSKLLKKQTLSN